MSTTAAKPIAVPDRLLYGPGPSTVEPRVLKAMGQPALGIRDPHFLELLSEIRAGLRDLFGTKNHITLPLPASGSGAMEAAVANFVLPGSKVAIFSAGYFADRIGAMAIRQRATVVRKEKAWGQVFTAAEAEEFIERERPDVVAFVQAETSTGAFQSGRAIAPAAKRSGALVIADCVTSLGAMAVEVDSVGIDVAFSCSQKGLSCPAGLSPISVSPFAWDLLQKRTEEPFTWYLDLRLLASYFEPPHAYHHTPSPPLCYAVYEALTMIEEEGLRNRWNRHYRAHQRVIAGLGKLGFRPLVENPDERVWHVTTVFPPAGVDEIQLRAKLLQKHKIEIGGGLGQLAGKILRVGTMGPLATDENVDSLVAAIADCM